MPVASPKAPQPKKQPQIAFPQRRIVRRVMVDYPARFQTVCGTKEGRLVDLSGRGAKFDIGASIDEATSGCLSIDQHEVYCHVVWSDGQHCGLSFDHELSADALNTVNAHSSEKLVPVACAELIPLGRKRQGRLVLDED